MTDHSLSRILALPGVENGETQYGLEIACGRPFCKLKRKAHFHCHLCNQVCTIFVIFVHKRINKHYPAVTTIFLSLA